ncbi:hypothetical protein [Dongia sp.]|uniref:hypothetical protein n=1 Tax=Dongia sp. TaxID=1977262 RepID=UPI0037500BA1
MAKSAARYAKKRPRRRRGGDDIEIIETTISEVVPNKFKIGGNAVEAEIRGCNLAEPGLRAKVLIIGGNISDSTITIEQPLPDAVTAQKFPITITVQDNARAGWRALLITTSDDIELDRTQIEIVN